MPCRPCRLSWMFRLSALLLISAIAPAAHAESSLPTPQRIVELFGFPKSVVFIATDPGQTTDLFRLGKPTRFRTYQNHDVTRFSIGIGVFDQGLTLSNKWIDAADRQIDMMKQSESLWPFSKQSPNFKFKLADKREGYNLLIGTLGGPIEITVLPARNKRRGIVIVMSYDKEDGVPLDEQMKKMPMPSRTGFQILQRIDAMINDDSPAVAPNGRKH